MALDNFKRTNWLLTVLLAAVFCGSAFAQGETGFLRGKGKLDLAASYSLDTYDQFWVGETKVHDPGVGRISRHTANLYAAYGITDTLDVTANASWVFVTSSGVFDDEDALQDMILALKWKALAWRVGPGELSILAHPGVKFPLTNYEDNAPNAVGDGQVDARLRGIIHYSFDNGVYLALESGYDVRFDDPDDEVPVNFSAGFTLWNAVTISGFYSYVNSLGGHDIGQGPFPGVEEDYQRVGGGVYWRINGTFGVFVKGWTTVDGKNTGDVDGFSVGGVVKF